MTILFTGIILTHGFQSIRSLNNLATLLKTTNMINSALTDYDQSVQEPKMMSLCHCNISQIFQK